MDQADLPFALQLLPQVTDIHFKNITFAAKVISPYAVKNYFTGQYLFGMPQE